jgi:hypothetical protein
MLVPILQAVAGVIVLVIAAATDSLLSLGGLLGGLLIVSALARFAVHERTKI